MSSSRIKNLQNKLEMKNKCPMASTAQDKNPSKTSL
jgi:hypothetical protein